MRADEGAAPQPFQDPSIYFLFRFKFDFSNAIKHKIFNKEIEVMMWVLCHTTTYSLEPHSQLGVEMGEERNSLY